MSTYLIHQISKSYRGRTVLAVEELAIAAGRCLALLGPSGAGKSTLLRLLNFLEVPEQGQLSYAGQIIAAGGPPLDVRREVTTVFQRPLLLDTSVWGNVAYGLRLRRRYAHTAVASALEQVGMSHLAHAAARTLSGGEAQRVALARAVVIQPRVLLLDEPTANLDPANVAVIEAVVQTLRTSGTTIVIVTHNLFQAQRLADDVALLIDGQLIESGPSAEFFRRPRDGRSQAFVAGRMIY
ncbi:MAG: phosphate ABC transporter ATP-binding protein [Candidatus Viridilinea halotolerans]|uniref:Phosphate ABC transporter ATP-binding protein n=1 Tax=Candidatus Viridilinea halotolerans TaxID=2491704 RepID=A0A426U3T1_9CHLR|nr:MAG: phosphate ABC transporter ATP-binding protein [Candidatus Viridilinea halotolerans]